MHLFPRLFDRRTLAVATSAGMLAAGAVSYTMYAASSPGQTVAVACDTSAGTELEQDVPHSVSGPDSVLSGSAATYTIDQSTLTLPASASGVKVNSYENIRTVVASYGVTVGGASITTPGSVEANVEVSGNTVTVVLPGPIAGGSTITTPLVSIEATVDAAPGATTGLEAGQPFYSLVANTSLAGAVSVTCDPKDDAQAANARLTVPVTTPDKTPPSISLIAPYDQAIYGYQQQVNATYTCNDASGIASCTGTVANGELIDTSTAGAKTFTVDATDNVGNTWSTTIDYVVLEEGAPPPASPVFTALNPGRLLDTRDGQSTIDGSSSGGGKVAGQVLELQIAGRHGVPANAVSAVLNVTATETEGAGYVTVYPCDAERPTASSLNYIAAGDTRANTVVSRLDNNGKACLYAFGARTHLLVDIDGYFPAGAPYSPINPGRLLDTRPGGTTVDDVGSGDGPSSSGKVTKVPVVGRHGVPASAVAVVMNVTAVGTQGPGFVTVYPCGETLPTASNVNFSDAGDVTPNAALAGIGDDGSVCLYSGGAGSDLLVDIVGYFPAGADYTAVIPGRLADSRQGAATIDDQMAGGGALEPGSPLTVQIAGRHGVPDDARAAVLNVTATEPTGPGFLTVWPCDEEQPNASKVNFVAAWQTRPNVVFAKLSGEGTICVATALSSTHVVVDVAGYFPDPDGPDVPIDPGPTTTTTTTTTVPNSSTTTTVPNSSTTTTTIPSEPGDPESPLACALYGDRAAAQTAYDGYISTYESLDPALQATVGLVLITLANQLDPNGNGIACEDYPYS